MNKLFEKITGVEPEMTPAEKTQSMEALVRDIDKIKVKIFDSMMLVTYIEENTTYEVPKRSKEDISTTQINRLYKLVCNEYAIFYSQLSKSEKSDIDKIKGKEKKPKDTGVLVEDFVYIKNEVLNIIKLLDYAKRKNLNLECQRNPYSIPKDFIECLIKQGEDEYQKYFSLLSDEEKIAFNTYKRL